MSICSKKKGTVVKYAHHLIFNVFLTDAQSEVVSEMLNISTLSLSIFYLHTHEFIQQVTHDARNRRLHKSIDCL